MNCYSTILFFSQKLRMRRNHQKLFLLLLYLENGSAFQILKPFHDVLTSIHFYKNVQMAFIIPTALLPFNNLFIIMRKKNLRIHKPKYISHTEPTSFFQMSEQSPKIDNLKKYLAELHEEPLRKDLQLSSSFSFDLSLAQWKSNTRLVQTVPISSIYKAKNMCLYSDQQEPLVEQRKQVQSTLSVKLNPYNNQSKERSKRKKMLLNFSKGRFRKNVVENNTTQSRQKTWIKPSIFSLEQPRNSESSYNSKLSTKKKIKLNFQSSRNEKSNIFNFTKSHKIQFDKIQTLHGIHCFRNKFQLILNSRSIKRKDFKLFKCSTIRPLLNIQISTPKIS